MKLQVIHYPNDILKKKSEPVEKVTPELIQLSKDMFDTLRAEFGLGLSAVQVGHLVQLIVMDVAGNKQVIFNPKILAQSPIRRINEEGCLSFPGRYIDCRRPTEVKISYLDINNNKRFAFFKGLEANVFFHEFDHLQGILYLDRESQ